MAVVLPEASVVSHVFAVPDPMVTAAPVKLVGVEFVVSELQLANSASASSNVKYRIRLIAVVDYVTSKLRQDDEPSPKCRF